MPSGALQGLDVPGPLFVFSASPPPPPPPPSFLPISLRKCVLLSMPVRYLRLFLPWTCCVWNPRLLKSKQASVSAVLTFVEELRDCPYQLFWQVVITFSVEFLKDFMPLFYDTLDCIWYLVQAPHFKLSLSPREVMWFAQDDTATARTRALIGTPSSLPNLIS